MQNIVLHGFIEIPPGPCEVPDAPLLDEAMAAFYKLRAVEGLRKPPSTSELIDWITALLAHGLPPEKIAEVPFIGTLLKREQDISLAKRRLH